MFSSPISSKINSFSAEVYPEYAYRSMAPSIPASHLTLPDAWLGLPELQKGGTYTVMARSTAGKEARKVLAPSFLERLSK
jgi:hypothetical protein